VHVESRPGRVRVQPRGCDTLLLGASEVDLRAVEQLDDPAQVRAVGWLLVHLSRLRDERVEPMAHLAAMVDRLAGGDWDWLSGRPDGDLALPRLQDAMAALNRLRGVRLAPP
jgi:predicted ABC-class ATPase